MSNLIFQNVIDNGNQARATISLRVRSSRTGSIINFGTVVDNTGGTAMTLSQGGGDSITINEDGIYAATLITSQSASGSNSAITRNLTVFNSSLDELLSISGNVSATTRSHGESWVGFLTSGDVIRALSENDGLADQYRFTIVQAVKL